MRIAFLDNNVMPYTSKDLYTNKIRGAESILINLAKNFKILGHEICVFNNVQNSIKLDGIYWYNINNIKNNDYFDVAITNNDLNLFNNINCKKKIALSHSIQTLEKFFRQNQFFPFFKHKPKIVFMSNYHENKRSFLLKLFGSIKIEWCVEEIFTITTLNNDIDNNKAIFTSRIDRNLNMLIDIWKDYICPINKNYKLFITPLKENLTKFNIHNRLFERKDKMINDLKSSRIYLIPGHKAELYCFAAEEARELCIPIVTLGIGSLSERVEHNVTGFIASTKKQFADYTIELFKNDELWSKFRKNLSEKRAKKNWLIVSKELLDKIS